MTILPEDRFFWGDAQQKEVAHHLYQQITDLPLISPHGHVNPEMFMNRDYSFGTPVDLLIIPDHYVYRLLYSQGIPLEKLGISRQDSSGVIERDHRAIWQTFAEHYYLFRGTPTGMWLNYELQLIFGISQKLNGSTAQAIYDQITEKLTTPEFRPRRLYERFNLEVLCTTDSPSSSLDVHRALRASGWGGRVLPTFRPDQVTNLSNENWRTEVNALQEASGIAISDYSTYIKALEQRRDYFKALGAVATDHAAESAYTAELSQTEVEAIFQRALHGRANAEDSFRFTGHMLMEMARMSIEDGLVMQLHTGALRDYDTTIFRFFGHDRGADIGTHSEFVHNLRPLLNKFGNDVRLNLIIFTLDEHCYARELAPLAGLYPALKLGPPWWFNDSLNGMQRFFTQVVETAGIYNTVGFNDDTRAYLSIPARHDLWRRASTDWLAGLVVRKIVDMEDAEEMSQELARYS
jgi:glucuronate isomerase